jgi:hypothetical protein
MSIPIEENFMTGEWGDIFLSDVNDTLLPDSSPQRADEIPTLLYQEVPQGEVLFPYFTTNINPPFITPWDSLNWRRIRNHIARLGAQNTTISATIRALEALYAQSAEATDITDAMPQYFTAKSSYVSMLKDEDADLEMTLIATFLLCCFEMVAQQDTVSTTPRQTGPVISRLETWSRGQPLTPIPRRIVAWFSMFHAKAMHSVIVAS